MPHRRSYIFCKKNYIVFWKIDTLAHDDTSPNNIWNHAFQNCSAMGLRCLYSIRTWQVMTKLPLKSKNTGTCINRKALLLGCKLTGKMYSRWTEHLRMCTWHKHYTRLKIIALIKYYTERNNRRVTKESKYVPIRPIVGRACKRCPVIAW